MKGELKFNNRKSPQTCCDSVSCYMYSRLPGKCSKTGNINQKYNSYDQRAVSVIVSQKDTMFPLLNYKMEMGQIK